MNISYEIKNIIGKWDLEKPFDLRKFMKFISKRDKETQFHFIGKDKQIIEINPLKFKIVPQKYYLQLTSSYFDVIERAPKSIARERTKTIESVRGKDITSKPVIVIENWRDPDIFTIVIAKCDTREMFRSYANKFIELLEEFGMSFEEQPQFTVENIILSGKVLLKKKLNLQTMSDQFKEMRKLLLDVEYNSKKFPGIMFTIREDKPFFRPRFLLFSTGGFIIAKGIKSELMIEIVIKDLEQVFSDALESLGEQAFL